MLATPLYVTKRRSRAARWLRPARSPASRTGHPPGSPWRASDMTAPDPAKPRQTPLRAVHERLGASMTEFAGG